MKPDQQHSISPSISHHDPCCDCQGFCRFPMGHASWSLIILSIASFLLSIFGVGGCNYIRINGLGWGLFWREETVEEDSLTSRKIHCTSFDNDQKDSFDAPYRFAIACAYILVVTGGIATGFTFTLSCGTLNKATLKTLGVAFLMVGLLELLTCFVLASELCDTTFRTEFNEEHENCQLSFGLGLTIGSVLFSLLAGVQALTHPVIPYARQLGADEHLDSVHHGDFIFAARPPANSDHIAQYPCEDTVDDQASAELKAKKETIDEDVAVLKNVPREPDEKEVDDEYNNPFVDDDEKEEVEAKSDDAINDEEWEEEVIDEESQAKTEPTDNSKSEPQEV